MTSPTERDPTPARRVGLLLEVVLFAGAWLGVLTLAPAASSSRIGAVDLLAFSAVAVPLTLLLTALFARLLHGERLADLGLRRPERGWPRTVVLGALAGLALMQAAGPLVSLLEALEVRHVMPFVVDGWAERFGAALSGLLAGGLMEELVYRGYAFRRLERACASSARPAQGVLVAALVTSVAFGATHAYQGPQAVVVVTFYGLGFAVVRQLARGQLWPVVIAHGTIDVVAFLFAV